MTLLCDGVSRAGVGFLVGRGGDPSRNGDGMPFHSHLNNGFEYLNIQFGCMALIFVFIEE
jgi:hypothetical protein